MRLVINEIRQAIVEYKIPVTYLSAVEYDFILKETSKKFTTSNYKFPLWDQLVDKESLYDSKGWSYVMNFTFNSKVVFFLEQEDGPLGLMINGLDLNFLLENTFGFVFYVTNLEFSYLLCFNDHDYLIACGTAIEWLKEIKKNLSE